MLGDMIGELKGKLTGSRVLSIECCPKIEVSVQGIGKIIGIDVTDIGTFWEMIKEDGSLYGEGQGVMMSNEGEIVTWEAQGLGKTKGKGAEWRGSAFLNTTSERFSCLNNTVVIFEYNIDDNGNADEKVWEWI